MNTALLRAERVLQRRGAALICDIDGTLAADVARRHLRPLPDPHCLEGVPIEQIERYMAPELVALDAPIEGASGLVASLLASPGEPRLLAVSARWNTLWGTTYHWLEQHYPGLDPYLLMRRRCDTRPSVEVKLELVRTYGDCAGGVWLDDDPQMLAAAERAGFVALKAPDIYRAALTSAGPQRFYRRRKREYLRSGDPRARFLAATAPDRIPTGSVLCLCGPDQHCLLCDYENENNNQE